MTHLTGTAALIRLILRRDRLRLTVWVSVIAGLVYAQAVSIKGLYPDPESLAAAGRLVEGNAAFIAMAGPPLALDTLGGRVAFEISAFAIVLAALMSIFLVTRHVRGDEEAGRAELLRSAVVGRHAAAASTLTVALLVALVLGGLITLALVACGLPVAGSWALALCISGVGLVFAAVAAVTAQVTVSTRAASGLAGAVLAASFVVRAIGDVGTGTLSWLSPMGWGQALRPFAGERWWPAALIVVSVIGMAGLALVVNDHRDVGAGIIQPRPGPARASGSRSRPVGLALRLQRGTLLSWGAGLFLGGVAYGSIGGDVEDLVGDSDVIADLVAQGGGNIVDSFLATAALVLALMAAGFAVQATLRLGGEEQSGRAEPVLATAVSRSRWAGSHLAVVTAGTFVVLGAAGLGTGISYGIVRSDAAQVPRLVAAALVYAPAVLVLAGTATALYGLARRAAPLAWAAVGACLIVGFLGPLLSLPPWLEDLSPFQHVPRMPSASFAPGPLIALAAVAGGFTALGSAALGRRDLGS